MPRPLILREGAPHISIHCYAPGDGDLAFVARYVDDMPTMGRKRGDAAHPGPTREECEKACPEGWEVYADGPYWRARKAGGLRSLPDLAARELEAQQVNAMAKREGWAVFDVGTAPSIQRDDELGAFQDDDEAFRHVTRLASAGSALHQAALALVGRDPSAASLMRHHLDVDHDAAVIAVQHVRMLDAVDDAPEVARTLDAVRCSVEGRLWFLSTLLRAKVKGAI